jgi:hypothetical protein
VQQESIDDGLRTEIPRNIMIHTDTPASTFTIVLVPAFVQYRPSTNHYSVFPVLNFNIRGPVTLIVWPVRTKVKVVPVCVPHAVRFVRD